MVKKTVATDMADSEVFIELPLKSAEELVAAYKATIAQRQTPVGLKGLVHIRAIEKLIKAKKGDA